MMKTLALYFALFWIANSVIGQSTRINISNPLEVAREEEVVEIPWTLLADRNPSLDTSAIKVLDAKTKKELVFQLEYKGLKQVQNLLVQVSVPARGNLPIEIVNGKHGAFAAKTFCRYVPERKDDFAWENDRIAFRMYGKALEATRENAYGIDVWVKRTERLILNERYQRGEYHVDHGDGLDYYHVGFSLGCGGIAPYLQDSIWFSKNYRQYEVLDNGPLRSSFRLSYDEWNVAGRSIRLFKTVSIDAGSQLSRQEINFTFNGDTSLPVVMGLIKRPASGEMLLDEASGIMGYWEPRHGEDGTTGTAVLVNTAPAKMEVNGAHLLVFANAYPAKPLVYYSGAAWDKAGKITCSGQWFDYLGQFQKRLKNPLKVSIQ